MSDLCSIFGVRHFSPAAALHVRKHLDSVDPDVVLIEGPSDATSELAHLGKKETAPPVAVLAFTKTRPVRSILYPMATYSAEWVAARWAIEKKRTLKFIDLPASVFLELHERDRVAAANDRARKLAEEAKGARGEDAHDEEAPPREAPEGPETSATQAYLGDPYEDIARLSGEADHETWWERHFEHTKDAEGYRGAIFEFGKGLGRARPSFARRTCAARSWRRRKGVRRKLS